MRPRPDEYIIETKVGKAIRNVVWQTDHALDIDLPRGWTLEKVDERILFKDTAVRPALKPAPNAKPSVPTNELWLDPFTDGETRHVRLPSSKVSRKNRPLTVTLKKLKTPRPVYVSNPSLSALHTLAPRQLCAFYGQRYFLVHYRPIGTSYAVNFQNSDVFSFQKSMGGYTLSARHHALRVNIGGRKVNVAAQTKLDLSEVDFFRATIVQGIHWWRFRMVPTPNGQPPLESDETDDDLREASRLQYSTVGFLSIFAVMLIAMQLVARYMPKPPKVIKAEVALKAPKVFPKFEEKHPDPPPPPPEVAKVEPPPPPKPEPKPEPVKKPDPVPVAKVKPKPTRKKVVASKPPPKAQAREPEPVEAAPEPKVVKDEGPTAEQLAATQKAEAQEAEKTQMLKSLNFLSTSAARPKVEATTYTSNEGKYADTAKAGGLVAKSNVLDKMVKGAPGDGDIKTKSGRNVASKLSFGKNKGLNDVQGKVSLAELSSKDGNLGSALGGAKGVQLSGPGSLTESEIEKALSKYLSKFQYCYEKSLLSDSSLTGNLVLQWDVSTAGKAANSRVVKSQLNNDGLHSCLLRVLSEVPFPQPKGGSVTVKKTFAFSSSSV